MDINDVKLITENVLKLVKENRDYLLDLDSQFGDGDLGISMVQGFSGLKDYLETSKEKDLGKLFFKMGMIFNESAPSSLGTIISFWLLGIGGSLKGKENADKNDMKIALENGISKLKERANSKENEKTILDSLSPAAKAFQKNTDEKKTVLEILKEASNAASKGSEATKNMTAVHGRAAYHGEKTIGHIDGGSYVGKLIFEGIYNYYKEKDEKLY
ncbi:dihydroxyacetone kinase subunit L [Leptotrichia sp. oral taxon 223]|uniref:dihydroxyacetone kinase subunit L n=1 Tax=Leptotrichia sp. oral taxon 223 TaxID=712363 RepID=UPI0015BBD5DA|nr:dihydroxyacetone kinase subunit L [Leptotrichia sp. oral taxon 223]NWO19592.1 dihydroxyacetone kinase subunit L [Leptotrichia sp. oral taxon 223]